MKPEKNTALVLESPSWKLELKTASDPVKDRSLLVSVLKDRGGTEIPQTAAAIKAPGSPKEEFRFPVSVFENRIYTLSVKPKGGIRILRVQHPYLRELEDSLEQDEVSLVWRGTLRTGNDIGWYPLEFLVEADRGDGQVSRWTEKASFMVWPLKLDLDRDLRALTRSVEQQYPLWLFRFGSPTRQSAGRSGRDNRGFLLVWLAQFEALRKDFFQGVRTVLASPHQLLEETTVRRRPECLRGRISPRLEEALRDGRHDQGRKFPVEVRNPSTDTPENRFVLSVVRQAADRLERFLRLSAGGTLAPGFLKTLEDWHRSLQAFSLAPVFRGVGEFSGLTQESLVLHHRAGYSAVYRTWLELRHYLDLFSENPRTRIGIRSLSEIYEVWCFLEIRRILKDLGFVEQQVRKPSLTRRGLEKGLKEGLGAAFRFRRPGGPDLRLAHEPVFGLIPKAGISSYAVPQKPDIFLEARWPCGTRLIWIFDAKYRLEDTWDRENAHLPSDGGRWRVPDDALNQMHRYRDALVQNLSGEKTRPVVEAFALWPGPYRQESEANPYAHSIREVGIGAFPLVPCPEGSPSGRLWLQNHLAGRLNSRPENILAAPGSRITQRPVSGH